MTFGYSLALNNIDGYVTDDEHGVLNFEGAEITSDKTITPIG